MGLGTDELWMERPEGVSLLNSFYLSEIGRAHV